MNLSLLRHLVLKDVRNQRLRLLLLWLMAYLIPLTVYIQNTPMTGLVIVARLGMIGLFALLIILIWVSAILLDPTYGSDRFLTTRPIDWRIVLADKVIFVVLFLWLPLVIFRLGNVLATGVPLSFIDQFYYLFETTLIFSAFCSIFVLPALFVQRLTTVILTLLGIAFSIFILCTLFTAARETFSQNASYDSSSYVEPGTDPANEHSLLISSYLVICALLALVMVPVAILRHWRSSVAVPLTLVFAACFLSLFYFDNWPYPLDQFASDQPLKPEPLPPPLRDQIQLTVTKSSWDVSRSWPQISDYEKQHRVFRLIQNIHVNGVPRPMFLRVTRNQMQIVLSSGFKLKDGNAAVQNDSVPYYWIYDYLRKTCAGVLPSNSNYENSDMHLIYDFVGHDEGKSARDIADQELPGASLRRILTAEVDRIDILKVVPFQVGARFNGKRQCFEVRQIVPSTRKIDYLMNCSSIDLLLRGDNGVTDRAVDYTIINRRTGEILEDQAPYGTGQNPFDNFDLQEDSLTKSRPRGSNRDQPLPVIPSNWLDDADICFYQVTALGTITFDLSGTVTDVITNSTDKSSSTGQK